jgi:hypothetical protein
MVEDDKVEMSTELPHREGQTLGDAVNGLVKEKGFTRIAAIKAVYEGLESGEYLLWDPNPPTSVFSFFFSLYNLPFWGMLLYFWLTLYSITEFVSYPLLYVRYVLTFFLTLFLPGYLIMDILMPRNFEKETVLKVSLGLILTFLLVGIIGFAAASSSLGLTENSTVIGIFGVTLVISIVWSLNKYQRRLY